MEAFTGSVPVGTGSMYDPSTDTRATRTAVIRSFLIENTHADLAQLYSHDMECQVNVAKDDGKTIDLEFRGKGFRAYRNASGETWKAFRIPLNAGTAPEYTDLPMTYDLARHAEGIGMTGWNWAQKKSIFVAFDFDAVVGHKQGLIDSELEELKRRACEIPWVTVRTSTSGSGLHLYVFLADPITTVTHHEHAALARSILSKMSALAGFDFGSKVDICGGNMWVWHRKMVEIDPITGVQSGKLKGLHLVKKGEPLTEVPSNWQSHLKVAKRQARRADLNLPTTSENLKEVLNERALVPLDEMHMDIIKALDGTDSWWDADHHLLVTHTWSLKQVHQSLGLKGTYNTVSEGKEQGQDHNCFAIPRPNGVFLVRRFNKTEECMPWTEDSWGYISTYFNRDPDFRTLAQSNGGIETERRGVMFHGTQSAEAILKELGFGLGLNSDYNREVTMKQDNEGRIIVKVKREALDSPVDFQGYEPNKDGSWTKIIRTGRRNVTEDLEPSTYDHVVRHLVGPTKKDTGWMLATETGFVEEPLVHVRLGLKSMGFSTKEIDSILGASVVAPWKVVCSPFEPEYPGNREWNLDSPQFLFSPKEDGDHLDYSYWTMILNNLGKGLDAAVAADEWCQANAIETGADYLKLWCASLFQQPKQPLPYLFFVGPQNCGKSILHEALSMLFSPGYILADNALKNPNDFNGELLNTVLCVIEEVDLSENKQAYNRIKDWVTSPRLLVHIKNKTPYLIENTTHWIQCANDARACPILPGDTRIVMIAVELLPHVIPKREMFEKLRSQASDFLTELLRIEIPLSPDRLNLPPLATEAKRSVEISNQNELENFIEEHLYEVPGEFITLDELHRTYLATLPAQQAARWSKQRLNKGIPLTGRKWLKGRLPTGEHVWGNMSFNPALGTEQSTWERKVNTVGDYLTLVPIVSVITETTEVDPQVQTEVER